jgi:cell division protein YceG involved in septum cleavage
LKEFVCVSAPSSLLSPPELEQQVQIRTGRRVRNLVIELESERVVLRGQVTTYYVKQLAQQSIQDLMPQVPLDNAIVVETR